MNFIDEKEPVQDGHGHGTHCCGTVAGPIQSQGFIRYGVAPDVELMVGKVMDDDGSGFDSDILEGISWAAENGARTISLSLGSSREAGEESSAVYEDIARQLLEEGNDCLLVAAAGNDSNRPDFVSAVNNPAACESFLSVAAVDKRGSIAPFSCAQLDSIGLVDISAPGVDVLSSFPGGKFAEMSGTSMATPHVVGVAALYLQRDPGLTAHRLWHILERNATPTSGPVTEFGRGLVQAP